VLQHPLTPRGKKIWLGDEGFDSSQQLIAAAVEASGRLVLSNASGKRGILRLVTKGDKQRRYCSPFCALHSEIHDASGVSICTFVLVKQV